MNKFILTTIIVIAISVPAAYAQDYVNLSSDYYEMGDFLYVQGYSKDYVSIDVEGKTVDIYGENFQKSYKTKFDGLYQVGLPLTKELGYSPGIYDVTISYGDTVKTQQFGLDVYVPTFTLQYEKSLVHLNEYAFFFGTVKGIDLYDHSFAGNVLIQILDSNGNLLEDNYIDPNKTSSDVELFATKSEFRAPIKTGTDLFMIPAQDRIHGDKLIFDNGYRVIIRMDPTIYKPYHTYTIKAMYNTLERSVNFMVLDYLLPQWDPNQDICIAEQKNLDHITGIYNEFVEAEIPSMALKYELLINNFKFSSGCE